MAAIDLHYAEKSVHIWPMRFLLFFTFLIAAYSSFAQDLSASYNPVQSDLQKADQFARETAAWFKYTTGPIDSEHLGQCGDYAVLRKRF